MMVVLVPEVIVPAPCCACRAGNVLPRRQPAASIRVTHASGDHPSMVRSEEPSLVKADVLQADQFPILCISMPREVFNFSFHMTLQ